ncbi:MAG: glycosyltransferase family 39 protein [Actinobacteria bacterium]|nr:glycosyltransferase family 39 protein [Actinomycetota bacterium]
MSLWPPVAIVVFTLPFAAVWLLLRDRHGRFGLEWREALGWSAVAWAVFSVVVIELLSLGAGHDPAAARGGHLTRGWLLLVWVPLAVWGAIVVIRRSKQLRTDLARLREALRGLLRCEQAMLATIAICVLVTAAVALVAAPNTWDSMTYHLARVDVWLQLGGVAHYATHVEPQLYHPPGAEYLIAQLQAVAGGDRLAALVQWAAYLLTVPVVSLAAARLGCGRRGQVIGAFLAATAPMALMQASSTQNDMVETLWLVLAATLALSAWRGGELAGTRAFVGAVALGLAVMTKGTALLIGAPVAALLAWSAWRGAGWRRAATAAICAALVTLLINGGPWLRNHETYDTPFATGSSTAIDYDNDRVAPAVLLSNLIRNAAIYLGTPSERVNELPTDAVRGALDAVGIDPDDPATTFGDRPFEVGRSGPHESHAASTVLFLLGIWAVVLALLPGRARERRAWALMLVAQALLFATALKWQTWHARLHLPILIAAVPLAAVALDELRSSKLRLGLLIVAGALTPILLAHNVMRPFAGDDSILTTPRTTQYFQQRPSLEAQYEAVVDFAERGRFDEVGIAGGIDDWEYPFFLLGREHGVRFRDVIVTNESSRYERAGMLPDMVVCLNCTYTQHERLKAGGLVAHPLPVRQPPGMSYEKGVGVELWVRPVELPRLTPPHAA